MAFAEACTLCNDCLAACPQKILVAGHAGYPIVDFTRGECTFCGACAQACEARCFQPRTERPWDLVAIIAETCVEAKGVSCRMCEDVCGVRAIRFRPAVGGRAQPILSAGDCTGCGACVGVCPVKAISIAAATPVAGGSA
jgi:ferredoxin-type protein NapF